MCSKAMCMHVIHVYCDVILYMYLVVKSSPNSHMLYLLQSSTTVDIRAVSTVDIRSVSTVDIRSVSTVDAS